MKPEVRDRIIRKHLEALMRELAKNGLEAVGMAGAVVEFAKSGEETSACHSFVFLQPDVVVGGEDVDERAFLMDVIHSMLEGVNKEWTCDEHHKH